MALFTWHEQTFRPRTAGVESCADAQVGAMSAIIRRSKSLKTNLLLLRNKFRTISLTQDYHALQHIAFTYGGIDLVPARSASHCAYSHFHFLSSTLLATLERHNPSSGIYKYPRYHIVEESGPSKRRRYQDVRHPSKFTLERR